MTVRAKITKAKTKEVAFWLSIGIFPFFFLAHSKGKGQGNANFFDCEHLTNDDRLGNITVAPKYDYRLSHLSEIVDCLIVDFRFTYGKYVETESKMKIPYDII